MENTISDDVLGRIPLPAEADLINKLAVGGLNVFLGQPVLEDVDLIVTSEDWDDGTLTIAAQPDVPRNLTLTLTDANASVTAGICTIVGVDNQGRAVTEVMDLTDGLSWVGTKIFATVTSATISGTTGAPLAGTDVVTVGVGALIGLPFDIDDDGAVRATYVANAKVTPDAIQTGESLSAISATGATYNGSKIMWAIVQPHLQA